MSIVTATHHLRRMPGGSQSHLLRGDDGQFYVVKFRNNPQHARLLFNEYFATLVARKIGLPVPPPAVIRVSEQLIQSTPRLTIQLRKTTVACEPGLQFGSQYIPGLGRGLVWDWVPSSIFPTLRNLKSFAGVLAFDQWTCNTDTRQAIYWKLSRQARYSVSFIDFGHCFSQSDWRLRNVPLRGGVPALRVYGKVRGWKAFEPWLGAIEACDEAALWEIALRVPPEWYSEDLGSLARLVEDLARQRHEIRRLITEFRDSPCDPFPNWSPRISLGRGGGEYTGREFLPQQFLA